MTNENNESEWKKKLNNEQFNVCRLGNTEQPFTGKWLANNEKGIYVCVACGQELFHSENKFDSGTGWPSFSDVLKQGMIETKDDNSYGVHRTEVVCSKCKSHLGHVFDDGPTETGKRYCVNSVSLDFKKK
ncbi:MAG: peptide-methionine (R)-S-oxide reductase MsrB [archaeon]|nr:peptide-methionine (R)-S-oxide reductase MsrB [archaeon]